ncbi:MAG: endonuclease III [Thermoanaerobacteraceae bacterium]|uniref:endonuclease III n=1 Tax=Thermanaeromonas sp. C210 TaxID=2731925 RepID=UPI00155D5375|nr:endonuclease III [Thermanaeromonas sp. C210]MBE3581498.1 endonuclease III [Thermoanaerobacteraceae bacterium]GFN22413.1 endonuclease III [Thermanaeromonas sp. C210]
MQPVEVQAVLQALERAYPHAGPQLKFENPFQLLVAAILSAQTTDKQVNKVTARLFAKYPTPRDLAQVSPDELEEDIKSLGLFRSKSRNLVAAAKMLLAQYGGEVPQSREELMALPGVGRKVANVVLSQAFGRDVIAVDTHVFRVTNRIGLVRARTPEEAEEQLTAILPPGSRGRAHHLFIFHGRYCCLARSPRCGECPVRGYCRYCDGHHGKS